MHKYLFVLLVMIIVSSENSAQENPAVIVTGNTENLVPEGIAVNDDSDSIYVTSIAQRKIVVIKKDGSHRNFIASGADGFGEGLGIKIDEKNNLLWAVSNRGEGKDTVSMVHAFDLRTAVMKHKFEFRDTVNHLFNDLIPDGKGNAYITATFGGEIFFADTKNEKLNILIKDTLSQFPNGIALKNNKLYIATYSHGILIYDLSSKRLSPLPGYTNKTYAFNLDGIGFYKNKLYGVYNADSINANNSVIEYELNDEGLKIVNERTLLKGHPLYHEPTTLSIADNRLFVLANSHIQAYYNNKESIQGIEDKLTPVAVIVYKLD